MYLAWRYGNEEPYRLYHFGTTAADQPSPYPSRVQSFIYACALMAREEHVESVNAVAGGGGAV